MKHKISLPRRAAAFALAFLLVLPNAYAAAGEQKLQTSTQIAQGLTYRNTVTVNDGSGHPVGHVEKVGVHAAYHVVAGGLGGGDGPVDGGGPGDHHRSG